MTTVLAPCRSRCSTSASKCARATISIRGFDFPGLLDDLSGLERIRDRDEQQLCLLQVRGAQDARVGGVPLDDFDRGGFELLDGILGVLDDEKRPAALAQHRTDKPSDPSIADQHDMPGETRRLRFLRRRRGAGGAVAAAWRRVRASHQLRAAKASGLSRIEIIEVARINCRACSSTMPSQIPRLARMNENSPICASAAATSSAASRRRRTP